ncbi:hypothetical protein [Streptomyces sp. NBC_00236]|uniref:hypothetical protein n=1 Tax=Streptomyces sp. NBC_00236 TaxID=2903639 RepID=UPI002E2DEB42|nr:hypothetical protein [Streptomyces sp. NBC_00236]
MDFAQRTIGIARLNVEEGGRPCATVIVKDWDERRLPMRYEERDTAVDVYRLWQERNDGKRRAADVPID